MEKGHAEVEGGEESCYLYQGSAAVLAEDSGRAGRDVVARAGDRSNPVGLGEVSRMQAIRAAYATRRGMTALVAEGSRPSSGGSPALTHLRRCFVLANMRIRLASTTRCIRPRRARRSELRIRGSRTGEPIHYK